MKFEEYLEESLSKWLDKNNYHPDTHVVVYKGAEHKVIKKENLKKFQADGWKERNSINSISKSNVVLK